MKPTKQDVANKAGVSTATVSRTFAHPDKVLQGTREKVMAAANELGFTVSRSASALKSQQSFRIALLVSESMATWFNAHICSALNDALQPHGYDICTYVITNATNRRQLFTGIPLRHNVDAVIVSSFDVDAAEIENLRRLEIPLIGINVPLPQGFDATVGIDEYTSMRLPIKHLHDLGHREICFVCSDSEQAPLPYSADLRADAFLRACHDIDADIQPSLIRVPREVDNPEDFAISQLLSRFPRPTAICCQGDMTAIPLLFKLPHCGIRIPQDISLIGFDDSTYAKQLDLTTVHQSVDYLGAEAGKRVLELIREQQPEVQHMVVNTYLALRSSTAPCHETKENAA